MTRYVFPELFHASGAPVVVKSAPRIALRWILHPSLGMPRALFHVWRFEGRLPTRELTAVSDTLDTGGRLLSWAGGPGAAIQLIVTVPAGAALVLRAFSRTAATGNAVDEEIVLGPVTNRAVVLFGSRIDSVTLFGSGTVSAARLVPLFELVNDPHWVLVETVGLPAGPGFAAGGYPVDPQGPVGAAQPPVDAAIARVSRGTPDAGWPAITDRGTSAPEFVPPDPTLLVTKELELLVDTVRRMLTDFADPAQHDDATYLVSVQAPRSVHGVAASTHWQARARASELRPLSSTLLAAGTDPFAALALGFGTTITPKDQPSPGVAPVPVPLDFTMLTVAHKVVKKIEFPPPMGEIEVVLEGELAALVMELQRAPLTAPVGLTAAPGPLDPRPHLDPPRLPDERWLEAAGLSWAVPVITADSATRPTAYAVARAFGAGPLEIRTEPRLSGGTTPFAAAHDPDVEPPAVIRYTDPGVAEQFPGDPLTAVYSVAATDWYGRWSDWVSADHPRIRVAPQVPAARRVTLDVSAGPAPSAAEAMVEFTWDWSYRRPQVVTLRVLVHEDGTPVPAVNGSVLEVGGPTSSDTLLNFSSASPDAPPTGVELVTEETNGNLRTYRTVIPGLNVDFDSHPRVRVTVRARATERVGFGLPSDFSPDVTAQAASPLPPPPPFIPAEMKWASVPDPRGIARTTLSWAPTAPRYAVYLADETALCRELELPSPDMEVSAADRLVALRPRPFDQARAAFRRLADNVTSSELPVELPRGSKMIHFYGIVPISATGAEGSLPAGGNDYVAVAAPTVQVPEPPKLAARDYGAGVTLLIEVPETRVRVGRIELFRAPSRHRAVQPEHAGPPIAVADASSGSRAGGVIRFAIDDPSPGKRGSRRSTGRWRGVRPTRAAASTVGARSRRARWRWSSRRPPHRRCSTCASKKSRRSRTTCW